MPAPGYERRLLVTMRRNASNTLNDLFCTNRGGYEAVLSWVSFISLMLLFSTLSYQQFDLLPPRGVFSLLMVTIFLGIYVFIAFIENVFAKYIIHFKTTQLFWVGLIAFLTYVAHAQAGDEINSIFGQDASTFPYATTAATAMVMASWSLWPGLCIGSISLIYSFYCMFRSKSSFALISLSIGINFFSFSGLVAHQMENEGVRKNNIYQVALAMDFNRHFRCQDARPEENSVAFLGSSQNSALVAPPIVVKNHNDKSIFRIVDIPDTFRRVNCN